MKLNQLVLLGVTSLIISTVPVLGQAAQITASQNLNNTNASNHSILVAQGQSKAVASGKFMAAEQKTTGSARIVTESSLTPKGISQTDYVHVVGLVDFFYFGS